MSVADGCGEVMAVDRVDERATGRAADVEPSDRHVARNAARTVAGPSLNRIWSPDMEVAGAMAGPVQQVAGDGLLQRRSFTRRTSSQNAFSPDHRHTLCTSPAIHLTEGSGW